MDEWGVADGHVDLLYDLERRGVSAAFAQVQDGIITPAALKAGRVRLMVCALYSEDRFNGAKRSVARLQELREQADAHLAALPRLRPGQPWSPCTQGTSAALLLENGDALLDADLDELEGWGLKVVGLTHVGGNRLADGNGVDAPQGLSAAGRALLRELARRDWVIDAAHLCEPALDEALRRYPGPLISSHTGLRRFCERRRNLSDDQAAAIVARGGLIGLTLAPEMLNGSSTAERTEVVRQLDWLVQRFGPRAVALGSDYGGFDGHCRGLESYAQWPLLAEDLLGLGYPTSAVGAILGENWLQFYRKIFL